MKAAPLALTLLLMGCGTEAAPPPAPEPEEEVAPEPPPPPPEPPPPPLPECPTDTWAVRAGDRTTAAADGAAAANLVRDATRGSWTRVSVCREIDGEDHQMICGPTPGGAECNIGLPGRVCSATLPGPVLPVAAGQFVDADAPPPPASSVWRCTTRG